MYFNRWVLKVGAGAGVVLISLHGNRLRYAIRLHFKASNNVAKYEGLVNGLRIASRLVVQRLYILGDSKLVIDQVMKDTACQNSKMEAYCQEDRKLEDKFEGLELHHIL